jgi:HAE1 family hydrophobic/amphiphilic exporter-1
MILSTFSVKRPVTILMIVTASIIFGVLSFLSLPVELMPDISYKMITIKVELRGGGLPPEETESLVIKPIEDAVGIVSNLDTITSTAEKERAIIRMYFIPGTNMDFASLEVREAFSKVKNKLPSICEKPVIAKYEENDKPILILAVMSIGEKHSTEEMRTIVDHEMKETLMRVNGVANVDVIGGRLQKVICNIEQPVIRGNKIPIRKIVNKIGVNTLNVTVGFREEPVYKKGIVLKSEYENIDEIRKVAITSSDKTGTQVLLEDIAKVDLDYMEAREIARYTSLEKREKEAQTSNIVSIRIQKESTANTVTVSDEVNVVLDGLEKELNQKYPDLRLFRVSDHARIIKEALEKVKDALLGGAFFAFIILLLFLMNLRTTLIIGVSMPISMLITFIFMKNIGIPINVYTLSGLALGAGMLVDSSICVLEHIFKKKMMGMNPLDAAIEGASEMVLEIIAGTTTTIVVFVPIFFVNEQIKMKFEGLAYTVIISLVTSLFVAVSVIPCLSARVHVKPKKGKSRLTVGFRRTYLKMLSFCLRFRTVLITFSVILLAFSIVLAQNLKQELTGGAEQNSFTVFVELPDGAKLEVSDMVVSEIEQLLKQEELFPEVEKVTANVEGWSSRVYVNLRPKKDRERTIKEVVEELRKTIPTLKTVKKTDAFVYFSEDGGEESEEIFLDVYGYDYELLKKLANEVAGKMEEVDGVVDAKLAMTEGRPEFWIIPKKFKAGEFGITTQEMAETMHAQLQGLRATAFHPKDGSGREIETIVRLDPKYVQSLEDVRNLTMMSPRNKLLFLKDIAFFDEGLSPSEIWRNNKSRMVRASATTTKLPMEEAINRIKEKLKTVKFPKDYYYVFSGAYYRMMENKRQLTWALVVTIILVYMVLACLFESYFQPLIIMTTVPLALIGAAISLWYFGRSITMGVFIGGIMLSGIVVNSAIILVSTINNFRREKHFSIYHAVLRGGLERTRPILMTSFTTMLGLFPLASDQSQFSSLWSPLAITVMGGLASATILTLLIVPGLYIVFEDIVNVGKRIGAYVAAPLTPVKFTIYMLTLFNLFVIGLGVYLKFFVG